MTTTTPIEPPLARLYSINAPRKCSLRDGDAKLNAREHRDRETYGETLERQIARRSEPLLSPDVATVRTPDGRLLATFHGADAEHLKARLAGMVLALDSTTSFMRALRPTPAQIRAMAEARQYPKA